MRWEELTGDLFPQAAAQAQGVCLLPLSCIERHAHHLPLGTDMLIGRELCRRAAQIEPAIIFPAFVLTQILQARHCAGRPKQASRRSGRRRLTVTPERRRRAKSSPSGLIWFTKLNWAPMER